MFYIGIVGSVNEWNAMERIHIKTAMPQLRADKMDAQMLRLYNTQWQL